jgi:formylglycine-generating enzyme required for sulfatase activity
MYRSSSAPFWAVFVLSALAETARGDEKKKEKAAEQQRIAALVLRLSDREYADREGAHKELLQIGEPALAAVRRAAETSSVPEAAARAQILARTILLGCRKSITTGLETCLIDPREFQMGSPSNERGRRPDETLHTVRIDHQFLLGRYEVTQDEYKKVMKVNPSWFSETGGGKDKAGERNTNRFPVEQVSWFDAIEFCNQLSQADGFPEYYSVTDLKSDGNTISSATVKIVGGNGYRLPTEAEWEYACRSGSPGPFHTGRTLTGDEGNFKMIVSIGYGSSEKPGLGRTGKVGAYKANGWDLHDMHGNAAEWCWDWYDKDYYGTSLKANPIGPEKGDHRVVRGGAWMGPDSSCRSASRFWLAPSERKEYVGFRVARTP